MRPVCICIAGGHAAGKTTLLREIKTVCAGRPEILFVEGDNQVAGGGRKAPAQYKRMASYWNDERYDAVLVEGTRPYSQVFRCAAASTFHRDLYVLLLFQQPAVHLVHLAHRAGKTKPGHAGSVKASEPKRYINAVDNLIKEGIPVAGQLRVWLDVERSQMVQAREWIQRILSPVREAA